MLQWILSLMIFACPTAPRYDFMDIAKAIDVAAHEAPLYKSDDGVERTVVELVAVGAWESAFKADAVASDWAGFSRGWAQVHDSNLPRLGITLIDAVTPLPAAKAALKLMAESHRICRHLPLEDQLSEYASGRALCDTPEGLRDSKNRMGLAARLLRVKGPRWVEPAASSGTFKVIL